MATVKFYLKRPKDKNTVIFARISFNYFEVNENSQKKYKQLKYYIQETINPKYWNAKTSRARESLAGHSEFNQRLNDIENIIKDVIRKMLNDGRGNEINIETLKTEIDNRLFKDNKVIKHQQTTVFFTDFIKTIMEESKNGTRVNPKTGKRLQKTTIISYDLTLKNLQKYEKNKKKRLRFSDITLRFYKEYVKYLNDNNFAVNTIGKFIKNIKVFMKAAYESGLTDNNDYQKDEFKKISEEVETIYLTEKELYKLYNLDLTNNPRLDKARDLFIIGCYTGLRFGDLQQLRKEHFKENTLHITTQKTGKKVVIPLHWTVKEIMQKYDYIPPRVISNQKMNQYIKELGKLAGIDEKVIITQSLGGLRYDKEYCKHELITIHTARRSFATNMFLNDIPTLAIMKITGHRTEKSFLKYIKISEDENAEKLLLHPFFQSKMSIGG